MTIKDVGALHGTKESGNAGLNVVCSFMFSFLAKHSIEGAGGSHWAPCWLMAVFRMLGGLCCFVLGVILFAKPSYMPETTPPMICVFAATFLVIGVTFVLLAMCSMLHGLEFESTMFAKFTLFSHTQVILIAVLMVDTAITEVVNGSPLASFIIFPIGLYFIDIIVLGSRMMLRFTYAFLAFVALAAILGINFMVNPTIARWAVDPQLVIAERDVRNWKLVLLQISTWFIMVLAVLFTLGVTRVQKWFVQLLFRLKTPGLDDECHEEV